MRALVLASYTLSALLLASCGGGSAEEPTTGGTGGAGAGGTTSGGDTPSAAATGDPANLPPMPEGITGPATPWDQMSGEERGRYMAEHVIPAMRPLFAAYDPARPELSCGGCHGPDARARHFEMPNPSLVRLPAPTDSAGWAALQSSQPRAMAFMGSRVEHVMAQLVGEQPYDPATQQGFGCFECHTQAE